MPDKRTATNNHDSESSAKRSMLSTSEIHTNHADRVIATLRHPLQASNASPFSAPPAFQQPVPICSFSFDHDRKQWYDDRSKRFYRGPPPYDLPHPQQTRVEPRFGADLNYGIDRFRQRDESIPEHLDALLASLQHRTESASDEAQRAEFEQERRRAHVITWRGIMTKLCTAYDQDPNARISDPFELNAMMLDDTLYLEEHVSASAKQDKAKREQQPNMKRFGYYGYSFESYCTVDTAQEVDQSFASHTSSGHPPGWSGDVDTNVQWCQVVRTKLGANRLIIGGEVDAVQQTSTCSENLVELKTSMQLTPHHHNPSKAMADQGKFEKKLLKFFLQSYLLGISKIVVGFRDHHGVLTTHQEFETLRLPRMVRAGHPIAGQLSYDGQPVIRQSSVWEPKDSLGFGEQILSFLYKVVRAQTLKALARTENGGKLDDAEAESTPMPATEEATKSYPVFRVSFLHPFDRVEIRSLSQQEIYEEVKDHGTSGDRVGFVPKSFYEFVQSQS